MAVEVDYRKYVDWFRDHNLNIRSYTPQEYVCGQYTVDMINASEKAGYKAYFAAVRFSDGTGHAIVSFKSTVTGFTSWYFFEPQTNNLLTPETLQQELGKNMGKQVTEVNTIKNIKNQANKHVNFKIKFYIQYLYAGGMAFAGSSFDFFNLSNGHLCHPNKSIVINP